MSPPPPPSSHTPSAPSPSYRNAGNVLDSELCVCGHSKEQHQGCSAPPKGSGRAMARSGASSTGNNYAGSSNGGSRRQERCSCSHYYAENRGGVEEPRVRSAADVREIRAWLQEELVKLENELTIILPERKANYGWGKRVGRITLCKELLSKIDAAAAVAE